MTTPSSPIDSIAKAMEGVTHAPGPWVSEDAAVYCDDVTGQRVADCKGEYLFWSKEKIRANADYIAACSPDRMREVLDLARQAEAMKRVIKEMQERYENWMPVGAPPSQYANPNALIHFQCFSEAEEDCENPEYFVTATWSERPDDAVRWCAINSPAFISRALIGGGNAED